MSAKRKSSSLRRRAPAAARVADGSLSETEATLALAAPRVAEPSPYLRNRLLTRARAANAAASNVTPAGWRFESTQAETGWRGGAFPGLRFKTLSVDDARDVVMVLIEMEAGARFPDHFHDAGSDEGIVISGDVITGGRLMRAGDYYFAAEGTPHTDTISPSGCTALVSLTARAWKQWREHMAST